MGAMVAQVNWGLETARKREVQTSEVKPVAGRAGKGGKGVYVKGMMGLVRSCILSF